MAWTDPKTMGHEPTLYSDWNTHVRDNLNYLYSKLRVRAWVNFNGTGTVAIRGSDNVSSITDNGAGKYTVNFTAALPSANYAVAGSAGGSTFGSPRSFVGNCLGNPTVSACSVGSTNDAGTFQDCEQIAVIAVGG